MIHLEFSPCLGVVLAGGLSSRMGEDKALLKRDKQTMLQFSQQLLKESGIDQIVVSGQQHGLADKYQALGPMGGIYSVIQRYHPKALLVLPVDLPLMHTSLIQQLKTTGELTNKACFFHNNSLPLYLPVSAFVEQFFADRFSDSVLKDTQKGPSIRSMFKQIPSQEIALKNQQYLFNANTPSQWQQAKDQFSNSRKTHV